MVSELKGSRQERCVVLISFILEKSYGREFFQDLQPSFTSSAGGAKSCLDHSFLAFPAYTSERSNLYQLRATTSLGRLIKSRVGNSAQTTPKQKSPIQIQTKLNVAWYIVIVRELIFQKQHIGQKVHLFNLESLMNSRAASPRAGKRRRKRKVSFWGVPSLD